LPSGAADRTLSIWVDPAANGTSSFGGGYVWEYGHFATANQILGIIIASGGTVLNVNDASSTLGCTATFTANTWYYVVITYDNASTNLTCFVNATQINQAARASLNTVVSSQSLQVLETDPAIFNLSCQCRVDEFRISDVVRSADWITTDFNNQNSPSTFFTFGTEVGVGTAVKHRVIAQ
jgi:hypothetical protein